MVPLLLLLFDLTGIAESMRLVVPTGASLAVISGIMLLSTFRTSKWIRKDVLLMMIIGAALGVPLGAYVLSSVESVILKRLFGFFLSCYAVKMFFRTKRREKEISNYVGLIAGFLGGCLSGMFGTGGPPAIIYLTSKIEDRRVFRATLLLYFLVANSWQCATFCYAGLINMEVLKFILYLMPAFIFGNLMGSIMHIKINQALFNKVIASILFATGALLAF